MNRINLKHQLIASCRKVFNFVHTVMRANNYRVFDSIDVDVESKWYVRLLDCRYVKLFTVSIIKPMKISCDSPTIVKIYLRTNGMPARVQKRAIL
jgi:hypothetical protein